MNDINDKEKNEELKKIRMRCHFSIIFESLWKFWAVIAIGLIGEVDTVFELIKDIGTEGFSEILAEGGIWGLIALLGITAIVLAVQYLRWSKTWVSLDDNLIIIEKNTINRKKNTIAVENISAVNIERNIFEQIVGTSRIKLDTNSMTTAEKTDVSIVFAERKAMDFRNAIIERMNMVNGMAQEEVKVQYEDAAVHPEIAEKVQVFSYSMLEIAKHNLFSVSIFNIVAVIGGIIGTIWLYMNMEEGDAIGTILALAVFIAGLAYNLVKRFITYYNFSVYRMGDDLHLKYGLFKLKNYTVPIDKITAIKLVQPTLSRVFGLYQAQVITVGLGDEEGEMANLTMAMPKDKLVSQMKVLLPEYNVEKFDQNICGEEKNAVKVKAVKSVKWILVTAAASAGALKAGMEWWIVAAAGIAFIVFIALLYILAHITAGYYVGEEQLILVDGHFAKQYTICKYNKVQMVSTTSGPLERKLGIVDGLIELLNSNASIPYVKPEISDKISDYVLYKAKNIVY